MSINRLGFTTAQPVQMIKSPAIYPPDVICKPAKADVQQLKSVRDDLANRFKENDKIIQSLKGFIHPHQTVERNTRQRVQRKLDKIVKQITAINNLIKFLETHLK